MEHRALLHRSLWGGLWRPWAGLRADPRAVLPPPTRPPLLHLGVEDLLLLLLFRAPAGGAGWAAPLGGAEEGGGGSRRSPGGPGAAPRGAIDPRDPRALRRDDDISRWPRARPGGPAPPGRGAAGRGSHAPAAAEESPRPSRTRNAPASMDRGPWNCAGSAPAAGSSLLLLLFLVFVRQTASHRRKKEPQAVWFSGGGADKTRRGRAGGGHGAGQEAADGDRQDPEEGDGGHRGLRHDLGQGPAALPRPPPPRPRASLPLVCTPPAPLPCLAGPPGRPARARAALGPCRGRSRPPPARRPAQRRPPAHPGAWRGGRRTLPGRERCKPPWAQGGAAGGCGPGELAGHPRRIVNMPPPPLPHSGRALRRVRPLPEAPELVAKSSVAKAPRGPPAAAPCGSGPPSPPGAQTCGRRTGNGRERRAGATGDRSRAAERGLTAGRSRRPPSRLAPPGGRRCTARRRRTRRRSTRAS